ncbi:hypothetical protein GOODEAATRI_033430 [Goodea atripinnis]|uniref:Uncharacterized protein n=1 Tax=Goodea atripinnis TaxID=208336 RepID=A0ABV0PJ41_9TELE
MNLLMQLNFSSLEFPVKYQDLLSCEKMLNSLTCCGYLKRTESHLHSFTLNERSSPVKEDATESLTQRRACPALLRILQLKEQFLRQIKNFKLKGSSAEKKFQDVPRASNKNTDHLLLQQVVVNASVCTVRGRFLESQEEKTKLCKKNKDGQQKTDERLSPLKTSSF